MGRGTIPDGALDLHGRLTAAAVRVIVGCLRAVGGLRGKSPSRKEYVAGGGGNDNDHDQRKGDELSPQPRSGLPFRLKNNRAELL